MREALPNASFIGFTGTPIELTDKNTRALFGKVPPKCPDTKMPNIRPGLTAGRAEQGRAGARARPTLHFNSLA